MSGPNESEPLVFDIPLVPLRADDQPLRQPFAENAGQSPGHRYGRFPGRNEHDPLYSVQVEIRARGGKPASLPAHAVQDDPLWVDGPKRSPVYSLGLRLERRPAFEFFPHSLIIQEYRPEDNPDVAARPEMCYKKSGPR